MRSICFYFQVHQPFRLRTYRFFDIGEKHNYYDDLNNRLILRRVADKCYIPTNQVMYDLIMKYGDKFKISYSISGVALEQFELYAPDVLESFKKLASTGSVEFLAETYSHSLSALKSKEEFKNQVDKQIEKVKEHFGQTPVTFRNTELIYSDHIGEMVADMGFDLMLTEGAKHVLSWKSPNYMYCNAINPKLKLLLKNFQLSDDIAFRFSQRSWEEWPLTTEKFVGWLNNIDPKQEVVNLFMDYETFGEHQWPETGIFDFLRALPERVFKETNVSFNTPSELGKQMQPVSAIHVPNPVSWADEERDLTAWLGNDLQDEAFDKLYYYENKIKHCSDEQIQRDWNLLQTSDHFYYMCTKWFSDGDVHKYFNPYGSPYEAFINYMNILSDFIIRVENCSQESQKTLTDQEDKQEESSQHSKKRSKTRKASAKSVSSTGKSKKDFHFSHLMDFSDTKLKNILRKLDVKDLSYSLVNADNDFKEKIFSNLGKRAQQKLQELEKRMPQVNEANIKKYRTRLERQIRKIL